MDSSYISLDPLQHDETREVTPLITQGPSHHSDTDSDIDPLDQSSSFNQPPLTEPDPPTAPLRPISKRWFPWTTAETLWLIVFLPLVSASYLAFCYTVHWNTVVLYSAWETPSVVYSNMLKTAVTTLSIVVVSLTLMPLSLMISSIKGEEFFRILSTRENGVPLRVVNSVSTPAAGLYDQALNVLHRQSSGAFTRAFFAALAGMATSALAPAILSSELVFIDDEVMAIRVGAVIENTVVNSSEFGYSKFSEALHLKGYQASSLPHVERVLRATYNWEAPASDSGTFFAVPTPLDIPLGMPVRYMTDVMMITPTCTWAAGEFTRGPGMYGRTVSWANFPDIGPTGVRVDYTWSIGVPPPDIDEFGMSLLESDQYYTWIDGNTGYKVDHYPLVDGTTVWTLAQCNQSHQAGNSTCAISDGDPAKVTRLDTSELPIVVHRESEVNNTWDMSFLICSTNLRVETREASVDSSGRITFRAPRAGASPYVPQGNINEMQGRALVQQIMDAGRSTGQRSFPLDDTRYDLGSISHIYIVFGRDVVSSISLEGKTIKPLPIDQITQNYGAAIQSLMKAFLDGTVTSRYVPGRLRKSAFILVSSLPHIIISTILYLSLTAFLILSHLRPLFPQFNFVNVAAPLADSDTPRLLKHYQEPTPDTDTDDQGTAETRMLELLGGRNVIVEGVAGQPSAVIHISDKVTA